MNNDPINRILIVGAGFEGWLTAASIAAQLPRNRIEIAVCAAPGADAWDRLYSVQPWHPDDSLHALGVSDQELVRLYDGLYALGVKCHLPWLPKASVVWPYGPVGVDYAGLAFHHHWRCERETVGDYFAFSPAARAMARNAFAPPMQRNAIGTLQHEIARHIDTAGVTTALRRRALAAGVERWSGKFAGLERDNDGISAIVNDNGERRTADVYIDASGPLRLLRHSDRWTKTAHTGAFSIKATAVQRQEPVAPWHHIAGHHNGWNINIPLQAREISIQLTMAQDDEPGDTLIPGRIENAWQGNVVTLGVAGCQLLPLLPLQTLLLTQSVNRFITMLPGQHFHADEATEFNQLTAQDADDANAMLSLFEQTRIHATPLARVVADSDIPQDSRTKLFAKRGWVAQSDSTLVTTTDWVKTYVMLGLIPEHSDVMVEQMQTTKRRQLLTNLATHIDQVVNDFPPLQRYMLAAIEASNSVPGKAHRQ
ncbi:MAG: tryptophan 7-halogenase [Pseudomonadota bacterium]